MCRSSSPNDLLPAVNRPESSAPRGLSSLAQLVSAGLYRRALQPLGSQRNDCRGRCTTRRTSLSSRSLPSKRSHDRPRRFLFDQLCVVNLARGVIQNDDQVIPAVVLQPAVLAAIDVQQHARKRPPLSTPPMRSASAAPFHQPRPLQYLLHPCVTQLQVVLALQFLVKMPDAE